MEILGSVILGVVAFALLVMIVGQGLRGTRDILSLRNIFLVGFIIFQLTSLIVTLQFHDVDEFAVPDPGGMIPMYLAFAGLFLVIFLWAYSRGWVVRKFAATKIRGQTAPSPTTLMLLSVVFFGIGVVFRYLLLLVPVFGPLSSMFGAGLLALAAGSAMWAWAQRFFNPVLATVALAVIGLSAFAVIYGTFGRRDVLGVVFAVGWGAYHGYWKALGPKKAIFRMISVAVPGVVLLATFTAIRHINKTERSFSQMISDAATANIFQGVLDLMSGQRAGAYSMYFMYTRPEALPYDTLHQVRLFLTMPVPRAIYPDKPVALALSSVKEVNVRNVPEGFNIGPGILGHCANDNPFIALPLYAILLALILRLADEMVSMYGYDPFVVLPVGTAIGQVLGLARGETGSFLFVGASAAAAAWITMRVCAVVFRALGWSRAAEEWTAGYDPDAPTVAYDDTP